MGYSINYFSMCDSVKEVHDRKNKQAQEQQTPNDELHGSMQPTFLTETLLENSTNYMSINDSLDNKHKRND